jgi:8-oxo-dGTP pyrophosphatase MutT (NUDIX family)
VSDDLPSFSEAAATREVIRKATAVVTRGDGAACEVLVFEHARTGLQLPAGTLEEGETFEEAAIRELAEETGLSDVTLHGELGYLDEVSPAGNPFHRHIFHFEPNHTVQDRWPYPCDCGDEITLYWASFASVRLDPHQQPWLDLARSVLGGSA